MAEDSNIYALSIVSDPAVESSVVMFNKETPKVEVKCFKDEEKKKYQICGAALIPNKEIYRNMDGNEFNIVFESDTIEKLAHKFLKDGGNLYMTKNHDGYCSGISVAESWIKMSENDKSVELGLDVPIGTWIVLAQVDSIELWDELQAGKLTGWSIESFVNLEEIINKKETDMSKQKEQNMEVNESYWTKLSTILKEALGTQKEDTKLEEETEETTEEVPVEEIVEEVVDTVEEETETTEEAAEDLQAIVDQLQEEVDALKAENEELKKANQKMSKKPSAKVNVKQSAEKSNPRDVIEKLYNGTYFNK